MKTCFKCGIAKERSEFYRHPTMGDGLLGKCKTCCKADVKANRIAKLLQYAAYEARRFNDPKRKKAIIETQRRYRAKNPEKVRARQVLARALKAGALAKSACVHCGSPHVQAHHTDYSKPLEVEWVCFKCHREKCHGQTVVTDKVQLPF